MKDIKRNKQPITAFLAVTLRCNSRCVMCDVWKRKHKKEEVKAKIYQKLPSSLTSIDITGGEPFLREDLIEVVDVLKRACPKAKLLITTNGLLSERIRKLTPKLLKRDKNLAFRVSLDGWGEIHERVRGVRGAFKKVQKTLNILKSLGVKDLGVIFTFMKINKNELKKILNFCKKEKLQFSFNLLHHSSILFGKNHLILNPDIKEIKEALGLVTKFFLSSPHPKNLAKAWFYHSCNFYVKNKKRILPCAAGENFFYMDPQGNIYICHFKNWKIGNLKNQQFSVIWQGKKRKEYLKMAEACNDCWMICTVKDEIRNKKKILKNLKKIIFFS